MFVRPWVSCSVCTCKTLLLVWQPVLRKPQVVPKPALHPQPWLHLWIPALGPCIGAEAGAVIWTTRPRWERLQAKLPLCLSYASPLPTHWRVPGSHQNLLQSKGWPAAAWWGPGGAGSAGHLFPQHKDLPGAWDQETDIPVSLEGVLKDCTPSLNRFFPGNTLYWDRMCKTDLGKHKTVLLSTQQVHR